MHGHITKMYELIQSDMERCYHKKENNVLMVGTTADGGATYCNAYDSKSKTFCKKLKNGCALHAVKRASVNGSDAPTPANVVGSSLGVAGNGGGAHPPNSNPHQHHHAAPSHRRSTPPHTCGCPTGDFQSGYPLNIFHPHSLSICLYSSSSQNTFTK